MRKLGVIGPQLPTLHIEGSAMRVFQRLLVLLMLGSLVAATDSPASAAAERPSVNRSVLWIYVGAYTKTPEEGINFFQFDTAARSATKPLVVARCANPTFLCPASPATAALCSQRGLRQSGRPGQRLSDPAGSGRLDAVKQQASGGAGPCHVSVDRTGQALVVANYGGGCVASLPIQPDGSLKPAATVDKHRGSSVNPARQGGPVRPLRPNRSYESLCLLGRPGDRQGDDLSARSEEGDARGA